MNIDMHLTGSVTEEEQETITVLRSCMIGTIMWWILLNGSEKCELYSGTTLREINTHIQDALGDRLDAL